MRIHAWEYDTLTVTPATARRRRRCRTAKARAAGSWVQAIPSPTYDEDGAWPRLLIFKRLKA